MSDKAKPPGLGFGTRALRAATTAPRVDQKPDAVPIYQAVTFSAEIDDLIADSDQALAAARTAVAASV